MALTEKQTEYLNSQISELSERAPSDSTIQLFFEKRKGCIKGVLEINAQHRRFSSSKAAPDPLQTFMLLIEDIDDQLLKWKRHRFSESLLWSFSRSTAQ